MNNIEANTAFDKLVKSIRKILQQRHVAKIEMTITRPDDGYTFYLNSKYLDYKFMQNQRPWHLYCNFDSRAVTLNNCETGFESLLEFSQKLPQIYADLSTSSRSLGH